MKYKPSIWLALVVVLSSLLAINLASAAPPFRPKPITLTIPPFITLTPTPTATTTGLPYPLNDPVLAWPPNGGLINIECPTFHYISAMGAIKHYLYLTAEKQTIIWGEEPVYFPRICETAPLIEGTYTWYIEGCRTGGCTRSTTWSFTVDFDAVLTATPMPSASPTRTPIASRTPTPEHSVVLRAPANGSTLANPMPVFEFDAPPGELYVLIESSAGGLNPPFYGLQPCPLNTCPLSISLPAQDDRPVEFRWYVLRCTGLDCFRTSEIWTFTVPGNLQPTPISTLANPGG